MKKILALLVTIVLVVLLISSCRVVNQYDNLIAAYQKAQRAAANGRFAVVMGFNKIQNYLDVYNKYLAADIEKTKAYREALNGFGVQLKDQLSQYPDDPTKLDLSELVNAKATPADMAITVNNYAVTLTEAPLATVDVESLKETNRYVNEAYNEVTAGVSDWNKAVEGYNTERTKASGDVVARVAQALGVRDLPEALPYFTPPSDTKFELPKVN